MNRINKTNFLNKKKLTIERLFGFSLTQKNLINSLGVVGLCSAI